MFSLVRRHRFFAFLGTLLLLSTACRSSPREDLARAAGRVRPSEGRLVGGFAYAPFKPASSRITREAKPREGLRRAAAGPEDTWEPISPEALAQKGAAELLSGNAEGSVARFTKAVALAPDDARWWSDLAAANLAISDDARHFLSALSASDRAVELDPGLREALFNRALALERLFLFTEARSAWDRYVQVGDDPDWVAEAKQRRAALDRSSEAERWKSVPDLLRRSALRSDSHSIERIVVQFPQRVRLYAEEDLLAAWGEAVHAGRPEEASQVLATAESVGRALARLSGDGLLLASVKAIQRSHNPARDGLVSGHRLYRNGILKLRKGDAEGAGSPLEAALQNLDRADSPFSLWARFALAHRDYLMGKTGQALAQFTELRRIGDKSSYRSLGGRASWLMGTVLLFQGRPSESLSAFRRSLELLEPTRERNHIAGIHLLLARNLDFLGDSKGAWTHRYAALKGAVEAGDADRVRIVFADAAWDLPEPKIALTFQEEAVRAARKLGDPGALSTALRQRAVIREKAGDLDGALSDLQGAETEAGRLSSESARATTFYELKVTEAQIRRNHDPAGALAAVEAALSKGKDRYFVPSLLVERARADLALGDSVTAERDLDAAIAEIETQRDEIEEALQRASYLDHVKEAYERIVDLRLANGKGSEAALNAAERARSRVLFDWVAALPAGAPGRAAALRSPPRPRLIADIRRELPPRTTIIEYMVREDRTLAWIFSADGMSFQTLPASAGQIESRLEIWRQALRRRNRNQELQAAENLYHLLITPLACHLRSGDTVVFIPDKMLYSFPFAALVNGETGRRLVQERIISVAPSANVLAVCLGRALTLRASAAPGVLVIANPDVDQTVFHDLPSLTVARREGIEVSSFHAPSLVLFGAKATKSRFMELASRYGIIHFVGHALRNRDNPLLSALLLAPEPAASDAGLLYAHELLGKLLPRTRLVVLSACSTGLGTPSQTEGALSLAAPFLAAGVPAVVASLWDVGDKASMRLMTSFHRHLHQGEDVAAALRSAQIEMIQGGDPALSDPQAWAPFELIGAS